MLFKDINQRFTEKVTEYLNKGYTLNAATMRGSQGEMANIDLTDGTEIIRILVERESGDWRAPSTVQLVVGRCTDKCSPDSSDDWQTLWNNHLEVIEIERFYLIGERGGKEYYGTQEEAAAASEKHMERYRRNKDSYNASTIKDLTSPEAIEIVVPYLRRMRGVKRINRNEVEIRKVKHFSGRTAYEVKYFNKTYELQ